MDQMIEALAKLISIVGRDLGWDDMEACYGQARLWVGGVRDGRIADVTIYAVTLAHEIGRY